MTTVDEEERRKAWHKWQDAQWESESAHAWQMTEAGHTVARLVLLPLVLPVLLVLLPVVLLLMVLLVLLLMLLHLLPLTSCGQRLRLCVVHVPAAAEPRA